MTRTRLILLAAGGSAALLLGAFIFQFFGYAPCKLCLWQRWPHAAAALVGLLALALPRITPLPLLGALAALTTSGIGGKCFETFSACSRPEASSRLIVTAGSAATPKASSIRLTMA